MRPLDKPFRKAKRGLATPLEARYNQSLFSIKEKENADLYVSL
jgi:hypothetical protein